GRIFALPATRIVLESTLRGRVAELLRQSGWDRKVALVADPDTYRAMGGWLEEELQDLEKVELILLSEKPHPDTAILAHIQERAKDAQALIAVGSGTINDLCKLASYRLGIPYAVFATAPSMNG